MMTVTNVADIPPVSRQEARALAATEYSRMADQLRSLGPGDWSRPTDCELWDVRAMAGHSVGMLSDFTSLGAMVRRMRSATKAAKLAGGPVVDSMTALQVAENAALSVDELIAVVETNGPRAAKWRTTGRTVLRRMPMKEEVGGQPETWKLGYLFETILTRDPWMHRVDIARATNREMVLTPEHDGRIVADVVAEWARRHGKPFVLELTGPIGATYLGNALDEQGNGSEVGIGGEASVAGAEEIVVDAVEFCRILSGRTDAAECTGLLAQPVPF